MNIERLNEAHEAELREAGIKPPYLIQRDKLTAAFLKYIQMKDSSAFYDGLYRLLKDNGVEQEAQSNIAAAAFGTKQCLIGAKAIFKALGLDIDKIDTERNDLHEHR